MKTQVLSLLVSSAAAFSFGNQVRTIGAVSNAITPGFSTNGRYQLSSRPTNPTYVSQNSFFNRYVNQKFGLFDATEVSAKCSRHIDYASCGAEFGCDWSPGTGCLDGDGTGLGGGQSGLNQALLEGLLTGKDLKDSLFVGGCDQINTCKECAGGQAGCVWRNGKCARTEEGGIACENDPFNCAKYESQCPKSGGSGKEPSLVKQIINQQLGQSLGPQLGNFAPLIKVKDWGASNSDSKKATKSAEVLCKLTPDCDITKLDTYENPLDVSNLIRDLGNPGASTNRQSTQNQQRYYQQPYSSRYYQQPYSSRGSYSSRGYQTRWYPSSSSRTYSNSEPIRTMSASNSEPIRTMSASNSEPIRTMSASEDAVIVGEDTMDAAESEASVTSEASNAPEESP